MQLFVKAQKITALDVQACDTVGSILQRLQVIAWYGLSNPWHGRQGARAPQRQRVSPFPPA